MQKNQDLGTGDIKSSMASGLSPASAYQHSFGALPSETAYVNPWEVTIDEKSGVSNLGNDSTRVKLGAIAQKGYSSIQQKALGPQTGGAGTAGYALVPIYVDPRIVDRSRKYTPLVEIFKRVTNQGMTADYNVITAKGSAVTAGLDATLAEQNDTYDRASQDIKFLYSVGRVLGPMQAAMPSYMLEGFQASGAGNVAGNPFTSLGAPNAKQTEVLVKARALKELEENLILNGDATSDATQFNGIIAQQSTTNQKDLSGAALTWDDVEDTVKLAYDDGGRPNLAVGSSGVLVALRKIMIDTFRMGPEQLTSGAALPFGIPPQLVIHTMVGPIPVLPSMYLTDTSGSRQLWFLDMDYIELRVLQDMTYEDLAKTNDSNKFMIKIYECLISRAPQFNSYIDNIA